MRAKERNIFDRKSLRCTTNNHQPKVLSPPTAYSYTPTTTPHHEAEHQARQQQHSLPPQPAVLHLLLIDPLLGEAVSLKDATDTNEIFFCFLLSSQLCCWKNHRRNSRGGAHIQRCLWFPPTTELISGARRLSRSHGKVVGVQPSLQ